MNNSDVKLILVQLAASQAGRLFTVPFVVLQSLLSVIQLLGSLVLVELLLQGLVLVGEGAYLVAHRITALAVRVFEFLESGTGSLEGAADAFDVLEVL